MIILTARILTGSGEIPKNITIDSVVLVTATADGATTFDWEVLSIPDGSGAIIQNPGDQAVRFGPLDTQGVYLVKVTTNRNAVNPQTKTITLNVPVVISPLPTAPDPLFDTSDRVRNFSFELPGILPGWAANWATRDDAGVLDQHAGTLRGRITPMNFTATHGTHVMCLGDDALGSVVSVSTGDVFSVSQDIDFTNVSILNVEIKYTKDV